MKRQHRSVPRWPWLRSPRWVPFALQGQRHGGWRWCQISGWEVEPGSSLLLTCQNGYHCSSTKSIHETVLVQQKWSTQEEQSILYYTVKIYHMDIKMTGLEKVAPFKHGCLSWVSTSNLFKRCGTCRCILFGVLRICFGCHWFWMILTHTQMFPQPVVPTAANLNLHLSLLAKPTRKETPWRCSTAKDMAVLERNIGFIYGWICASIAPKTSGGIKLFPLKWWEQSAYSIYTYNGPNIISWLSE